MENENEAKERRTVVGGWWWRAKKLPKATLKRDRRDGRLAGRLRRRLKTRRQDHFESLSDRRVRRLKIKIEA